MSSYATAIDLGVQGIKSTIRTKRSNRFRAVPRLLSSHQLSMYWVFRGANLELNPGDILIVLGDDPIQGTSLMRSICGLLPADEGEVKSDSGSLLLTKVKARDVKSLSLRQSIFMLAGLYGLTDRQVSDRFDEIVRMAGIQKHLNELVEEAPAHFRTQVAFAIAMVAPVDVLAFDGTAVVGDAKFQLQCPFRLAAARDSGQALMIATEDLALIRSLGSKAIVLGDESSRSISITEAESLVQDRKARRRRERRRGRNRNDDEPRDNT